MNALILRSPAAAAPYLAALQPLGVSAVACAVTTTTRLDAGVRQLRQALASLGDGGGIFVASHQGVVALREAMAAATLSGDARWHVATAGDATREALANAAVDLPRLREHLASLVAITATPTGSIGANAAAYFAALRSPHVLLPRAAGGRNEILEALTARQLAYTAIACYETHPVAIDAHLGRQLDALRAGAFRLVIAMAPSAIAALAAALAPTTSLAELPCRWLAIGETTLAALAAAHIAANEMRAAATPTPQGVAQAVADWQETL